MVPLPCFSWDEMLWLVLGLVLGPVGSSYVKCGRPKSGGDWSGMMDDREQ